VTRDLFRLPGARLLAGQTGPSAPVEQQAISGRIERGAHDDERRGAEEESFQDTRQHRR
jgi:hypothetical protein